jgi:acetamidase/formamidase
MATYTLEPNAQTLHGCFSSDLLPALTIEPEDTVRLRALDADWITEFRVSFENLPTTMESLGERFSPRFMPRDEGHALIGPIEIRGAQPGMMLSIHINRIIPGEWGWVYPWFGTPYEQKDEVPIILWKLDAQTMSGRNQFGHTVSLRPFMGVMGMPTNEPGVLVTKTPRRTGGNIDCKELVAGSTLYLPIEVEGGLFSVGDGHAVQGDGEAGGTAIECPMALVDLTFDLVTAPPIPTAHANTPSGWITFGFDEDLQVACDKALAAMVDLITALYNVPRILALGLAGATVDLRVTQIVNHVCGVHAVLPYGAIR